MDIDGKIVRSPLKTLEVPHCDLWTFVQDSFTRNRNSLALVDPLKKVSLTFGELYDHVTCIASNLVALGYNRECPLVIYMNNCVEFVMVILAVWRLGGSVAVINHLLTASEISTYLELLDADILLCNQTTVNNAVKASDGSTIKRLICTECHPGCLLFSQLCQSPKGGIFNFPSVINPRDTAVMAFSSGTTGPPKCVEISHHGLAEVIIGMVEAIGLKYLSNGGIIYQPMSGLLGFVMMLCFYRCAQKIIMMPKFGLETFVNYIYTYKIEILFIVPPLAVVLCKTPLSQKYDLSSVKLIICGSAPLGRDSEEELKKVFKNGAKVKQVYGLTETCGGGCIVPYNDDSAPTGSVGVPYPNTQAKIIDIDTRRSLGPHMSGELCFKSNCFMNGYLKNPKATADMIRDGWIHTGDIAYYDNSGYFFIVDRLKELIKYKGYQVAPSELEAILLTHPGLSDVGVTSVPDQEAGELPQAWVVLKPGVSLSQEDIQAFLAGKVAPFKRLRGGVKLVQSIPKSPTGKIMRRLMKQHSVQSKL